MTRLTAAFKCYVFGLVVTAALSSTLLWAKRAQAQTAGTISLVTPVTLSPASPGVNQVTTATFTVQNTGGQEITVQSFVAAPRNPSNANGDSPAPHPVTLQPGQQYTYSASRSFSSAGTYNVFPDWWDGTTWFQLAAPKSFAVGSPGKISLVTAVALSPASPAANQSTTATFTVQNTGGQAITAQSFVAAARNPSNANVDFPATAPVTLQPGQQYTYTASRSFSPAGTYNVFPAYWDGTTWFQIAAPTNFTVGTTTPGAFSLVTPVALSPASPGVNQATTATFTVQNTGGQAITAQSFVAAARNPSNANVDFPATAPVTLQPGQQYTYTASRSFSPAGTYNVFPAYWDGTTWFQIAAPTNFTVGTTTPGAFSLVTPVALSPASPGVNQATTATFTVQNTGGQAITAQSFVAAARNPSNANVDFPASAPVTLQPGQQYTYSASKSFSPAGTYNVFPAYWDGTTWFQIAAPTNFTVGTTTPGAFSLVTPVALSPASPGVNQATTATFTVQNTGGQAITAQSFVAAARNPSNAN